MGANILWTNKIKTMSVNYRPTLRRADGGEVYFGASRHHILLAQRGSGDRRDRHAINTLKSLIIRDQRIRSSVLLENKSLSGKKENFSFSPLSFWRRLTKERKTENRAKSSSINLREEFYRLKKERSISRKSGGEKLKKSKYIVFKDAVSFSHILQHLLHLILKICIVFVCHMPLKPLLLS